MSERLTTAWTERSAGAFGASGLKGDRGEIFLAAVMDKWHWFYELHVGLDSKDYQIKGVDISFRNPSWANFYTADIKCNLNDYGYFFIETDSDGWLFNRKKVSHRIWHVNPTTGWMAWYDREEMKRYIQSQGLLNTGLYKVGPKELTHLITRRREIVDLNFNMEDDVDTPFFKR